MDLIGNLLCMNFICMVMSINKTANDEKKNFVIGLNLAYTLSERGSVDMSGNIYNLGKFYGSAAFVAVEDINR